MEQLLEPIVQIGIWQYYTPEVRQKITDLGVCHSIIYMDRQAALVMV